MVTLLQNFVDKCIFKKLVYYSMVFARRPCRYLNVFNMMQLVPQPKSGINIGRNWYPRGNLGMFALKKVSTHIYEDGNNIGINWYPRGNLGMLALKKSQHSYL